MRSCMQGNSGGNAGFAGSTSAGPHWSLRTKVGNLPQDQDGQPARRNFRMLQVASSPPNLVVAATQCLRGVAARPLRLFDHHCA
eukprot:CAMPEP_0172922222 /NCGR_PEP_ID=MMETSP1075-20121228/207411_1 /TAXON_ID=2916 /ORGANISM="Ceratium fusus, Strain PA161109" /LENGTH=83 /DNA_ID=CAMNT_0013782511 /DNA_START=167 /DNA_END=418 /DNA_ORIENTATION=+